MGNQRQFSQLEESQRDFTREQFTSQAGITRVREVDGDPDVTDATVLTLPDGTIVSGVGGNVVLQFPDHDYAGRFELPGIGTGDVPNGKWAFWVDTNSGQVFHVTNLNGTLKYVELT